MTKLDKFTDIYPRPARSLFDGTNYRPGIALTPSETIYLKVTFELEIDAIKAAEAWCAGDKTMEDYERTNDEYTEGI